MATKTGIGAQWGFKAETTWGTAVVVDTFLPLISESIQRTEEFTESEAIIAGRRVLQSDYWNGGNITVEGNISTQLWDTDTRTLLTHMFGTESGAGTAGNPYLYVPEDMDGLGMTIQIGRPGVGGTVHPFTYEGCKFSGWEIACSAGEMATLSLDVVGEAEATGTALASASYTASILPFKFSGTTVTVAGTDVGINCTGITIACDNMLSTDRRFLGTQSIAQPLEMGLREYTGTIDLEFYDLTVYNNFVNRTEVAVVTTFTRGSKTLTLTKNVRLDGVTPNVDGRGILTQSVPYKCIASGTADSSAIKAELVNA